MNLSNGRRTAGRRWAAALLLMLVAGIETNVHAQNKSEDQVAETPLGIRQEGVQRRLTDWEQELLRLSTMLENSDPKHAEMLVKALKHSHGKLLKRQFSEIIERLQSNDFDRAEALQGEVLQDLQAMLELLTRPADMEAEKRQKEAEDLERVIQEIDDILKRQQQLKQENWKRTHGEEYRQSLRQRMRKLKGIIDEQKNLLEETERTVAIDDQKQGKLLNKQTKLRERTDRLMREDPLVEMNTEDRARGRPDNERPEARSGDEEADLPAPARELLQAERHQKAAAERMKENESREVQASQEDAAEALKRARETLTEEEGAVQRKMKDLEAFLEALRQMEEAQRALKDKTESGADDQAARKPAGESPERREAAARKMKDIDDMLDALDRMERKQRALEEEARDVADKERFASLSPQQWAKEKNALDEQLKRLDDMLKAVDGLEDEQRALKKKTDAAGMENVDRMPPEEWAKENDAVDKQLKTLDDVLKALDGLEGQQRALKKETEAARGEEPPSQRYPRERAHEEMPVNRQLKDVDRLIKALERLEREQQALRRRTADNDDSDELKALSEPQQRLKGRLSQIQKDLDQAPSLLPEGDVPGEKKKPSERTSTPPGTDKQTARQPVAHEEKTPAESATPARRVTSPTTARKDQQAKPAAQPTDDGRPPSHLPKGTERESVKDAVKKALQNAGGSQKRAAEKLQAGDPAAAKEQEQAEREMRKASRKLMKVRENLVPRRQDRQERMPGEPSKSAQQSSGKKSDQPGKSGQKPGQPGKSGQKSGQPGKSGQKSGQPGKSGQKPGQPGKSGQKSGQPGKSGQKPGQPGKSGQKSGQPGKSGQKSGQPGKSGQKSGQPGKSGQKPGQPGKSGQKPGQPGKSGQKSGQPGKSGQKSGQPGKSGQKSGQPGKSGQQSGQPGPSDSKPGPSGNRERLASLAPRQEQLRKELDNLRQHLKPASGRLTPKEDTVGPRPSAGSSKPGEGDKPTRGANPASGASKASSPGSQQSARSAGGAGRPAGGRPAPYQRPASRESRASARSALLNAADSQQTAAKKLRANNPSAAQDQARAAQAMREAGRDLRMLKDGLLKRQNALRNLRPAAASGMVPRMPGRHAGAPGNRARFPGLASQQEQLRKKLGHLQQAMKKPGFPAENASVPGRGTQAAPSPNTPTQSGQPSPSGIEATPTSPIQKAFQDAAGSQDRATEKLRSNSLSAARDQEQAVQGLRRANSALQGLRDRLARRRHRLQGFKPGAPSRGTPHMSGQQPGASGNREGLPRLAPEQGQLLEDLKRLQQAARQVPALNQRAGTPASERGANHQPGPARSPRSGNGTMPEQPPANAGPPRGAGPASASVQKRFEDAAGSLKRAADGLRANNPGAVREQQQAARDLQMARGALRKLRDRLDRGMQAPQGPGRSGSSPGPQARTPGFREGLARLAPQQEQLQSRLRDFRRDLQRAPGLRPAAGGPGSSPMDASLPQSLQHAAANQQRAADRLRSNDPAAAHAQEQAAENLRQATGALKQLNARLSKRQKELRNHIKELDDIRKGQRRLSADARTAASKQGFSEENMRRQSGLGGASRELAAKLARAHERRQSPAAQYPNQSNPKGPGNHSGGLRAPPRGENAGQRQGNQTGQSGQPNAGSPSSRGQTTGGQPPGNQAGQKSGQPNAGSPPSRGQASAGQRQGNQAGQSGPPNAGSPSSRGQASGGQRPGNQAGQSGQPNAGSPSSRGQASGGQRPGNQAGQSGQPNAGSPSGRGQASGGQRQGNASDQKSAAGLGRQSRSGSSALAPVGGQRALKEAVKAQQESETNLASGLNKAAVADQKRALDSLRKSLKDLQQERDLLRANPLDANMRMANQQRRLAEEAGRLKNRLEDQNASQTAGSPTGGSQSGGSQSGGSKSGGSKSGGSKSGGSKSGGSKSGGSKSGGSKSGGSKSGGSKSGGSKSGGSQSGGSQSGGSQSGGSQSGGSQSGGSQSGGSQSGGSKSGGSKSGGSKSGGSKSGGSKSGGSKSGGSKSGGSKSGGSKSGGSASGDAKPDGYRPPQTPKEALRRTSKDVGQAQDQMKGAAKSLDENKGEDAETKQKEAIDKLKKAKQELKKQLQGQEDWLKKFLRATLEQRLQKMREQQLKVNDLTRDLLELKKQGAWSRASRIGCRNAAGLERQIGVFHAETIQEASRAKRGPRPMKTLILDHILERLRQDIHSVYERLAEEDVDLLTQRIEREIIEGIDDVLAALQYERGTRKVKSPPPKKKTKGKSKKKKKKGGGGKKKEPKFLPKSIEIRLLRTLQARVYERTKLIDRLAREKGFNDGLKASFKKTSDMQGEIVKLLGKMATSRGD